MLIFVVALTSGTYEVDSKAYETFKEEVYDKKKVEKIQDKGDTVVLKGRLVWQLEVEPSNTVQEVMGLIALFQGFFSFF